jgi:bifunctional non-homologous end joining protein LigD
MLATLAEPPLTGTGLLFEPKYDGIRALIHVPAGKAAAGRPDDRVRIWSRLGNEKTAQFPTVVQALDAWRKTLRAPLLVDGELVALDEQGRPAGFQRLQGRIHLTSAKDVERIDRQQPVALIVFDLLRDGDEDVRGLPLTDRRARLIARAGSPEGPHVARPSRTDATQPSRTDVAQPFRAAAIRISEQVAKDGRAFYERAIKEGWEGLIVKEALSPYQSGRRSPAWRKLKVVQRQEFIVGGWTEPRQTRPYLGALLLGVWEAPGGPRANERSLKYVGHTGTGFNDAELARVYKLLKPLETTQSPFSERFKTNEPAHWVRPELVAEVRFTEWTADGKLRHPVYLGIRDDKKPEDVYEDRPKRAERPPSEARRQARSASAEGRKAAGGGAPAALRKAAAPESGHEFTAHERVVAQLQALEESRRDGTIALADGARLGVTNLHKVFWPALKLTKGDLLRYYAEIAPLILPAVTDRPLVMKRFPNGIEGQAFYQHQRVKEKPPAGVRVESVPGDLEMFIGGSLATLLYMTQIAAISQDPWFSRVQSPLDADYVAIDLDPGDGTPFSRVIDVARWVHDELESLGVPSVPKTSGSRGLHVYIPLAKGTSYESGMLFCQIVATLIASRHPKEATVERTVAARRKGTVYVDYLQNIIGKTLATAYSARASAFAGVSTPLEWKEVEPALDPRDFTIVTAPARFRKTGDLWARLRTSRPANLQAVFKKYKR